eukprot:Skav201715  [mRNA]  locus=scaffold311:183048:184830:- [translate_table: standard]
MAWIEVCTAWRDKLSELWLLQTLKLSLVAAGRRNGSVLEQQCAQLLQLTRAGATQRGHLGMGNYLNLMFCCAILIASSIRPLPFALCVALGSVALLAPPEIFDIDIRRAAGGFRSVGGPWLRYVMATRRSHEPGG